MPPRSTSGRFSALLLDHPFRLNSMKLVTEETRRTPSLTSSPSILALALVGPSPLPLRTLPSIVAPTVC